jgi:hypothetical protein
MVFNVDDKLLQRIELMKKHICIHDQKENLFYCLGLRPYRSCISVNGFGAGNLPASRHPD